MRQPLPVRFQPRIAYLVAALAAFLSCTDAPTGPRQAVGGLSRAVERPNLPIPSSLVDSSSSEAPPAGQAELGQLVATDTLAIYTTPTVVRIGMAGRTVRVLTDPNGLYPPVSNDYGVNGVIEDGTCKLFSAIRWEGGGFLPGTCEHPNTGNKLFSYERLATVVGVLRLVTGPPLNNGGPYCCNTYSVESRASVVPLAGLLTFDADSTSDETGERGTVASGGALRYWNQRVEFRVRTNVVEGVTLPLVLRKWEFIPEGRVLDSLTIQAVRNCSLESWAPGLGVCIARIRQSGTLVVEALVNGYARRVTWSVTVARGMDMEAAPGTVNAGDSVSFAVSARTGFALDSVLSWEWVADSAPGRTSASSCGVADSCRTSVYEKGWMHAVARINGHLEMDSVRIEVNSVPRCQLEGWTPRESWRTANLPEGCEPPSGAFLIRIFSPSGLTRPSQPRVLGGVCRVPEIPSEITLELMAENVGSGNRGPAAGKQIRLGIEAVPNDGGHTHGGSKPLGSLETTEVSTGSDGRATVRYLVSEAAGRYIITAKGQDNVLPFVFADTVTVGVGGLVSLRDDSPHYRMVGAGADKHPSRHNAAPAMREALDELASYFFGEFGQQIGYNDLSLPQGGKFDIDGAWAPNRHCSHRRGTDVDVQTRLMSDQQRRYLKMQWADVLHGRVVPEGDHFHLKLNP